MVQLEEVADEDFFATQPGPKEDEDDWDTDSASDISDIEDEDDALEETLADRLSALVDIVPPTYRKNISQATSTVTSWAQTGLSWSGKAAWVVSTSVLLLGVPWAMAFSEEQQVQEMEREMRAQQSANEMLTSPSGQAKAAL